jgi:hypothetical protein
MCATPPAARPAAAARGAQGATETPATATTRTVSLYVGTGPPRRLVETSPGIPDGVLDVTAANQLAFPIGPVADDLAQVTGIGRDRARAINRAGGRRKDQLLVSRAGSGPGVLKVEEKAVAQRGRSVGASHGEIGRAVAGHLDQVPGVTDHNCVRDGVAIDLHRAATAGRGRKLHNRVLHVRRFERGIGRIEPHEPRMESPPRSDVERLCGSQRHLQALHVDKAVANHRPLHRHFE